MDSLVLGLTIGLAAGVSPGPLLLLVIIATLRSGWRAGALTAIAPLITDAVVIAGSLLVLSRVPGWVLDALGVFGGAYVIWLAVETWRSVGSAFVAEGNAAGTQTGVLRRAVLVNVLSPHPWITWATVMGPLVLEAVKGGAGVGALLVVGFYVTLVGSKLLVALLVARGRHFVNGQGYHVLLRSASALLLAAGAVLAAQSAAALMQ